MSSEIPTSTIQRTGIYTNHEKQQWEAWRVDQETLVRSLVGTCGFELGEEGRKEWLRMMQKRNQFDQYLLPNPSNMLLKDC